MNPGWNGTPLLIAAGGVIAFMAFKRAGRISAAAARAHLKKGALVIDVRSPGEFNSRHLAGAINLPLDEIETALPARVSDKSQVLLLHCQSGMRSGVARQKLKNLGYINTFNLGAYGRAESILKP